MAGARVAKSGLVEWRGWQVLIVAGLILLVIASALGVIYTRFQTQNLFGQLETLRQEKETMDIEWGLLQLEQSSWAAHGRVEEIARTRLGMSLPAPEQVVIINQ